MRIKTTCALCKLFLRGPAEQIRVVISLRLQGKTRCPPFRVLNRFSLILSSTGKRLCFVMDKSRLVYISGARIQCMVCLQ
jgi:hypothetical protein